MKSNNCLNAVLVSGTSETMRTSMRTLADIKAMQGGLPSYIVCNVSLDTDPLPDVGRSPTPSICNPRFSFAEVQRAMFKMRCGRGADGNGLGF